MSKTALPIFVESLRMNRQNLEDERTMQLLRQTLWAITTWLTSPTLEMRSSFIRNEGLAALLELDVDRSPPEIQRFVRVSLSFVLGKTGEDLSTITAVLKAHMQVCG